MDSLIRLVCLLMLVSQIYQFVFADDPLQDFCRGDLTAPPSINGLPCKTSSEVTLEDFFFDGLVTEGNTSNAFGSDVTMGNVLKFPGLNTQGMSMNRVDIAPGGLVPPHIHPRAGESGFVLEGTVLVGFLTADKVFHSKVLTVGWMFAIPKGLVHFAVNIGEGKALILSAFNSQLPGTVVVGSNLFGASPAIPDEVLAKAFQVEESVAARIKGKFSG
ncbi:hypothetical protein MLD38_039457 [Melastoma candidum]|uniref:Uncharacterized protein n=1 Tax=Melastoma candidum TaxID=119954 RepID=A0ACB9L377_9MYRT|nr:hypothetical protein MLD38_039457 [Melastoma candidum]